VDQDNDPLSFLKSIQGDCGGVITFERFMQEALHHPVFGYYAKHIQDVGSKGDFSTSATLDPHLGKAIARWCVARSWELGWKTIPIIEIGAGSGHLARLVLKHLGWRNRFRTDYMICETSPTLRKRQEKNLQWYRIRWINSLEEGLKKTEGKALIFSNELVDAFPCRVFQKSEGFWRELGITLHADGSLSEKLLAPIDDDTWLQDFSTLPEGQRVERHDSYRSWLQQWGPQWREGRLLTIDYGDRSASLYAGSPRGSLRAYWKHQRYSGRNLYARFGKQDLTADVNFSDLIEWGKCLGWGERDFMTQREFLKQWIPKKDLFRSSSRFLVPGDAGDAFKVLEQSPAIL
jgi:SAM-dependent MidA family methyltransferase